MAVIYRQIESGGSGGDAQTLDTLDSTDFARLNAASNFTITPTVGGSPVLTSAPGTIIPDGFQHVQSVASTSWLVDHNFNTDKLVVQVFDSTGEVIEPQSVVKTTLNRVTVNFVQNQTGSVSVAVFA